MTDSSPRIEVFDPPMCCSTGVCGTEVDPQLSQFAADLDWLAQQGVSVRRYNLAQEPQAFMANAEVQAVVNQTEGAGLPAIVINGRMISQGVYLTREQLVSLVQSANGTGASASLMPNAAKPGGGCCGPEGCC